MAVLTEYLWIAVVGGFFGFFYAFGIGANDVANAFASTVSSKSLTLKQAILVASVFEFSGAFFLGASVTSTIRSKIFDTDLYEDEPEIVMLGMMTSLISATFMLMVATSYGLPVSTTHTVVGCIMGFSICAKGFDSIQWDEVNKIFISWAVSPLVSGVVAFLLFGSLRIVVLRSEHALNRAILTFPLVLLVGVGIDLFYVLRKGLTNKTTIGLEIVLPVSFGTGALLGLIWLFFVGPFVKRRIEAKFLLQDNELLPANADEELTVEHAPSAVSDQNVVPEGEQSDIAEATSDERKGDASENNELVSSTEVHMKESIAKRSLSKRFADATYGQDLQTQSMHENHRAAALWDDKEVFDPHAEELFTYIQVFTACLNSFAHGANDVANAVAPISAIIHIYQTGVLSSKSPVQKWILAYGGAGIVVGLLLYGYKVIKSLGYKVTPLSPSRGACAELAASLFVVTASYMSIPVSSTQSIVGAVAGVGLAGGLRNLQWFFLARICLGWIVVYFSAVIVSAGLFSFCAFSPSLSTPVG